MEDVFMVMVHEPSAANGLKVATRFHFRANGFDPRYVVLQEEPQTAQPDHKREWYVGSGVRSSDVQKERRFWLHHPFDRRRRLIQPINILVFVARIVIGAIR